MSKAMSLKLDNDLYEIIEQESESRGIPKTEVVKRILVKDLIQGKVRVYENLERKER